MMWSNLYYYLIPLGILIFFVLGFLWVRYQMRSSEKILVEKLKSATFDVMDQNNRRFLDMADIVLEKYRIQTEGTSAIREKSLEISLASIKGALEKFEQVHQEIEKKREGAYGALQEQIKSLLTSENLLRSETASLSKALRSPNVSGSWGQIHLRRAFEIAGLLDHCDFLEQKTIYASEGILRPDVVVYLPGNRNIVIDAKTPISAYLEASASDDEGLQKQKLVQHAQDVKKHIKNLSSKEYWKQFHPSPEYVILFLPAEAFFSAALKYDPTLLECSLSLNVVLTTPTTLIAILRAIALGWKQEHLSQNAEEIAHIGQELYERLQITLSHWNKMGRSLTQTVDMYNQSLASLESRVMVSAKKLQEKGRFTQQLDLRQEIDRKVRGVRTDLEEKV
ncbi:MAG: DNA recombination protein RmuC [Parachlamydiales bacterium]|nr:DNA recombination protein RmuC [Parachlamydiales bacterium]